MCFNDNGYVLLKDFLDRDSCDKLTDELKKLIKDGVSKKDEQCPLSDAVYGTSTFDSLLEQLLPHFENVTGKKLYPTYAYARMYAPGDELKLHIDRNSCEISSTITLGFDGEHWPIYMADESTTGEKFVTQQGTSVCLGNISEVKMNVGDAVVYKGTEKYHWRNKFSGKWQAQVFLHYVDAQGENANLKYDGRTKLEHHTGLESAFKHYPDFMTISSCQSFIKSVEPSFDAEIAKIGGGLEGIVDKEIRDVKKIPMPTYRGLGATMVGAGLSANKEKWNFDVTHSDQTDYLIYDENGHYKSHIDTFLDGKDNTTRKLTILTFLNDDFEGGKLYLQIGNEKFYPPQQAGTTLVFPSFILHGVEPVTKGIRRSVVTWLLGPWFK